MGLFIGASILTILELFDYVYEVIKVKTASKLLCNLQLSSFYKIGNFCRKNLGVKHCENASVKKKLPLPGPSLKNIDNEAVSFHSQSSLPVRFSPPEVNSNYRIKNITKQTLDTKHWIRTMNRHWTKNQNVL